MLCANGLEARILSVQSHGKYIFRLLSSKMEIWEHEDQYRISVIKGGYGRYKTNTNVLHSIRADIIEASQSEFPNSKRQLAC